MATVVFVCNSTPYKVIIDLPRKAYFSVESVGEAAKQQNCKPLPRLPPGHFEVITRCNNFQVALFKHKNTAGCRATSSHHHRDLPHPVRSRKNVTDLTHESHIRVGYPYMFGHTQPYNVVNQEVVLSTPVLPSIGADDTESSRTAQNKGNSKLQQILPICQRRRHPYCMEGGSGRFSWGDPASSK